jgi:hypothetical protein
MKTLHGELYQKSVGVYSYVDEVPQIYLEGGLEEYYKLRVQNPIIEALKSLGVLNNKHIPSLKIQEMFDSKVLAGLIDTDGYLGEGGYDFCFANKTLRRYRPTWITGFQVQTSSQLKTCTNAPEDKTMSSLPIIYIRW